MLEENLPNRPFQYLSGCKKFPELLSYYQNNLPEEEDGSVAGLVLYQWLPL
jgi:hypothetical protein